MNPHSIEHVLQKIKGELDRLNSNVPKTIDTKMVELKEQRRRVSNFVEVIAEGRGTRSVTDALAASEGQMETLEAEIEILQRSLTDSFQVPPRIWIEERMRDFQQTLELNTGLSALILRKVLGRIRLEVVVPEVGHPYYVAHTKLDVVELLDPRTPNFRGDTSTLRDAAPRRGFEYITLVEAGGITLAKSQPEDGTYFCEIPQIPLKLPPKCSDSDTPVTSWLLSLFVANRLAQLLRDSLHASDSRRGGIASRFRLLRVAPA